ncbi:type III polyketide synthase [Kitasatospora sp. DSM 101779]|uniref:type III polyketide synthase n=1 Tax=Kitasatospora sp. DSM 101779 TaxID=2853165 RepID=UPI0021D95E49|nr:3-oxoacyl-[acyl-carrier-protein] synthase III C-terminal domain-containing protein [Kitasatospora sp. DSM 101779]MCU7825611.1 type III polyketide synthase [Kitasatospora sp. DSM 101779]
MTRIVAVSGVLPVHRYRQEEITEALAVLCLPPDADRAVLERLHAGAGVATRHLALPLERYAGIDGFGQANDAFIAAALELGERAARTALAESGLAAEEIELVVSTSVTGIAAPSLEARLAGPLGLRQDVRRLPVFGLGCAAGAAGLARVHDYLAGRPDHAALLLSTELCSLTLQRSDASTANLVASALFGDGAGALLAVGPEHPRFHDSPGPRVVATRSRLYPGTGHLLGWDIGDRGFRIVLGGALPELAGLHVAEEVAAFLAEHDLKPDEVAAWICHPGGPKVLDALGEALGLPESALAPSRRSLGLVGNLSSASVLHILRDVQADGPPPPGSAGVVLALGPGFCSELVLLRW